MNVQSLASSRYTPRDNNITQKFVGRKGDKNELLTEGFNLLKEFIPTGLTNYNQNIIKDVLSICFSIHNPQTLNPQEDSKCAQLLNIAGELNKNTSRLFKVVFPRSTVDLAVMCYIMSKTDAFLEDESLNIDGFRGFLYEMLGNSLAVDVFSNIKPNYLNNIKKDEDGRVRCNNYSFEYEPLVVHAQYNKNLSILQNNDDRSVESCNEAFKKICDLQVQHKLDPILDLNHKYVERVCHAVSQNQNNFENRDWHVFLTFLYTSLPELHNNLIEPLEDMLYTHLMGDKGRFIKFYIALSQLKSNNPALNQKFLSLHAKFKDRFIGEVTELYTVLATGNQLSEDQLVLAQCINENLKPLPNVNNPLRGNLNILRDGILKDLNIVCTKYYNGIPDIQIQDNNEPYILTVLQQYIDKFGEYSLRLTDIDQLINFGLRVLKEIVVFYRELEAKLNSISLGINKYKDINDFRLLANEVCSVNSTEIEMVGVHMYPQFHEIKLNFIHIVSAHVEKYVSCLQPGFLNWRSLSVRIEAVSKLLDILRTIMVAKKGNKLLEDDGDLAVIITQAEKGIGGGLELIETAAMSDDDDKNKLNIIKEQWSKYLRGETIWGELINGIIL